jgi:hypothetical protein
MLLEILHFLYYNLLELLVKMEAKLIHFYFTKMYLLGCIYAYCFLCSWDNVMNARRSLYSAVVAN